MMPTSDSFSNKFKTRLRMKKWKKIYQANAYVEVFLETLHCRRSLEAVKGLLGFFAHLFSQSC